MTNKIFRHSTSRTAKSIMLAFSLTIPQISHAYLLNGEDLKTILENNKAEATGYIEGVADTINNSFFCIPSGTSTKLLKEIILDYLSNSPELKESTGSVMVIKALGEKWPC